MLAVDNKSARPPGASSRPWRATPSTRTASAAGQHGHRGLELPQPVCHALVRKLANSNNFVLQAATRCLRQVPGNTKPARVYLTDSNKKTLEDQLAETYGTSLKALDTQQAERVEKTIVLHKPHLPALLIKKRVLRYPTQGSPR
jgi:type III restriction enzyme